MEISHAQCDGGLPESSDDPNQQNAVSQVSSQYGLRQDVSFPQFERFTGSRTLPLGEKSARRRPSLK